MLRFNIHIDSDEGSRLQKVLQTNCRSFSLVTIREMEQGMRMDYAYHIKLRKGIQGANFIQAIKSLNSVQQVNLLMQETTVDL